MSDFSILEIYDVETGERKALREFDTLIEAPNWLSDGDTLLYNSGGRIWTYSVARDEAKLLETGECDHCNNDHVPSPDGKYLAVSHNPPMKEGWGSYIYIMPMGSGDARRVTPLSPSFLHGWSVKNELAYCAFRGESEGERKVDIFTMPAEGGEEKRLTDGVGYNDGPEYSPDGEEIWFCSTRGKSGLMQIFKMNRDGSGVTQITDTDENCWFPHLSPDASKVVYLTFRKGDLEPHEHLPDKNVALWLMKPDGSERKKLFDLFGGQGTINVNSWSPDGKKFAFVSYR